MLRGLGEAVFADGSCAHVDIVVYATGHRITFPFFSAEFVSAPDNRISLYQRMFHPDMADLAFIGLVQPLGAVMPIAEEQAGWSRTTSAGGTPCRRAPRCAPPSLATMPRCARYIGSKRHTIQVDFDVYLHALRQERTRGAKRAGATV